MTDRAVDAAMAAQRPEKATIRDLWVAEVQRADGISAPGEVPLYLTLPGREGADLKALTDARVLELTETGAIADPGTIRIVAVESSPQAVIRLNELFPGLKILESSLESLLQSGSELAWPSKINRRWFRAQVVNFDLNEALSARLRQGKVTFPALALVAKVARLHAEDPHVDWTLCLTLHGELAWGDNADSKVCRFLSGNFQEEPQFSEAAQVLLGEELHAAIIAAPETVRLCKRTASEQQRVMMVLVPKAVARDAYAMGWRVATVENVRYGGSDQRAPMVSWILRFTWDERASSEPLAIYRDGLREALGRRGRIDADGALHRDAT
jgi:hypothetical protein